MPRAPTCGEYVTGVAVSSAAIGGVAYGVAWAVTGFEGWHWWPHQTLLAGGIVFVSFVLVVGGLNRAHRRAVDEFSKGKTGPGPEAYGPGSWPDR